MIKYGCMAVAIACSLAAPAAQAHGNFFVAGQAGHATYDEAAFDDESADTGAFSGGYRWQAGAVTQVGVEIGAGKVDEIGQDHYYHAIGVNGPDYYETGHIGMDATYRHIGANARFNFGQDSRWFALARGGYMRYEQSLSGSYAAYYGNNLYDSRSLSSNDDGSGAYFGGGIGFDVSKNFSVNLMVNGYAYSNFESDGYDDTDIGTASTTTLGLEVRF